MISAVAFVDVRERYLSFVPSFVPRGVSESTGRIPCPDREVLEKSLSLSSFFFFLSSVLHSVEL